MILALVCFAGARGTATCAAANPSDADGDGIPRVWELAHGLNDHDPTDAVEDHDDDGLDARAEFLTGGRPWGQFRLHRFPWHRLPASLPARDISGVEFIGANRSGEFLLNCQDARGVHTILWTLTPGAPRAAAEITLLPEPLAPGVLWNDHALALVPSPHAGRGTLRNLRSASTGPRPVSWPEGAIPSALANDGHLLLRWREHASVTLAGSVRSAFHHFQWTTPDAESLTFGHDAARTTFTCGTASDPISGSWLLGAFSHDAAPGEVVAWRLHPSRGPEPLPAFPDTWRGGVFHAASATAAVGTARNGDGMAQAAVLIDGRGWHRIAGGAAGPVPSVTGVSDASLVVGSHADSGRPFLWKNSRSVALSVARPGAVIQRPGLAPDGSIHGLDAGKFNAVPQPVVYQSVPSRLGDGAAARLSGPAPADTDRDGIPDHRESAAGTNPLHADSDGDGRADLWDLVVPSSPGAGTLPEVRAVAAAQTGLLVFTPHLHPLTRSVDQRP